MQIEYDEDRKPKIMGECPLCGAEYRMGGYEGHYLKHYDLEICGTCFSGYWDGIAPGVENKFIEHLQEKGLNIPERNDRGLFPRGNS